MRISHKHKFIFLAVPRTGSTTVRKVLDRYSDITSVHPTGDPKESPFVDHISAAELMSIFQSMGWDWNNYLKFCFVRNPFDRTVSLYHHKLKNIRRKRTPGIKGALRKMKNSLVTPITFQRYVEQIDVNKRLPTSIKSFAFDDSDNCLVDEILRFEDLRQDLPRLLKRCDIKISADAIPHLNSTSRRLAYREYYDDYARERVRLLYKYEIDRFGYTF